MASTLVELAAELGAEWDAATGCAQRVAHTEHRLVKKKEIQDERCKCL
jgi:hypothetical protein